MDALDETGGHLEPKAPDQADDQNTGVRRSSRARKVPTKYDEEYIIPAHDASSQQAPKQSRPKRKAGQAAAEAVAPQDTRSLLQEVLSGMSPDERKEYGGWVELESEPGFFNAMLQELGAKELKVQEIYSLDADTLGLLPKPVHGLIFLFEYEGSSEPSDDENRPDCPDQLWFANQTTANACATVALMNIVMNAQGVGLDTQLRDFKNSTMDLPPPHRGHFLDESDFIRSIHNSVARRIDLLAEDLALDNKHESSLKKKRKKATNTTTTPKKSSAASRRVRKKRNVDTNYHYIAYVPLNGQVWELDGFQAKPLCLGPIADSWLDIASAAILERMMSNSDFSSYSLLSICQSPLQTLSNDLATSLACSCTLHNMFSGDQTWTIPDPFQVFPNARLMQRGLTTKTVISQRHPESFQAKVGHADFAIAEAAELARELRTEQDSLDAQYVAELATVDEAVETVRGRQRDYTPAIHQWVQALAEKGVLRELIQEMED